MARPDNGALFGPPRCTRNKPNREREEKHDPPKITHVPRRALRESHRPWEKEQEQGHHTNEHRQLPKRAPLRLHLNGVLAGLAAGAGGLARWPLAGLGGGGDG